MRTIEQLEAHCERREREINDDTCEQALYVSDRTVVAVCELRMLLDTIADLRSATRIRVTAEKMPPDFGEVLAWCPVNEEWQTQYTDIDRFDRFTHWMPLPERPRR